MLQSCLGEKYLHVRLFADRTRISTRRIHILVALTFIGPKPTPKHEVNHKNGDKLDNRVENLEYMSKDDNEHHAAVNALKAWGERSARSKLTNDQVWEIRRSREPGRVLAARFGVGHGAIEAVRAGRTWRHLV